MQFNAQKLASAAALTSGVMYLVCVVVAVAWPEVALKLVGWLAHIVNIEKFAGDVAVTAGGVAIGLLEVMVYGYIAAWIFASIYNRLLK